MAKFDWDYIKTELPFYSGWSFHVNDADFCHGGKDKLCPSAPVSVREDGPYGDDECGCSYVRMAFCKEHTIEAFNNRHWGLNVPHLRMEKGV